MIAPPIDAIASLAERMNGFWFSQLIHTLAVLDIADHVATEPPGTSTKELAKASSTDEDSLRRLLRAANSIGLFEASADDHWMHTPETLMLRDDAPGDLKGRALALGTLAWQSWGELTHAVRTGEPAFDHVHGKSFFEHLQADPGSSALFGRTMSSFTKATAAAVAHAKPIPTAKQIMDLGGGHGSMLEALLTANPGAQGVLFDTPSVVAEGGPALTTTRDRCRLVAGDFFEAVPPGADVIVLSWILHDWDDTQCVAILENCRGALAAGGELLIVEMVVGPGAGVATSFFDLEMLVQTGGRERSREHHENLLSRAGFELQAVIDLPLPQSVLIAQISE